MFLPQIAKIFSRVFFSRKINFALILICFFVLGNESRAQQSLYPLVKRIKGEVFGIDKNKESKAVDLKSQFNERTQLKTGNNSTITLWLDVDTLITVQENSLIEIPAIEWESRKISDIVVLSGQMFYSNSKTTERYLRTLISRTRVTEGSWKLSFDEKTAIAEIFSQKGVVDFRGLENEEGVVVESLKKVSFKGVLENNNIVYDELLKGRKVARGLLTEIQDLSAEDLKQFEVNKEEVKEVKKVIVKKMKAAPDQICSAPFAKFNQCSWICENNPKAAKKCLVDKKGVQCARYRCDANGKWVDKSVIGPLKAPCENEPLVNACDY